MTRAPCGLRPLRSHPSLCTSVAGCARWREVSRGSGGGYRRSDGGPRTVRDALTTASVDSSPDHAPMSGDSDARQLRSFGTRRRPGGRAPSGTSALARCWIRPPCADDLIEITWSPVNAADDVTPWERAVDGRRFLTETDWVAEISETVLIAELEKRLTSTYADIPAVRVSSVIQSARARFDDSPIRDFVPLLVERRARAQLDHATADTSLVSS